MILNCIHVVQLNEEQIRRNYKEIFGGNATGVMNGCWEFSLPKCKVVQYGHVKHESKYTMKDISIIHTSLPVVAEKKDLGVKFEGSLKFNKQVLDVVNRTKRLIGMIKRTFANMKQHFSPYTQVL